LTDIPEEVNNKRRKKAPRVTLLKLSENSKEFIELL
jgi:hypothetical protein